LADTSQPHVKLGNRLRAAAADVTLNHSWPNTPPRFTGTTEGVGNAAEMAPLTDAYAEIRV